MLSNQHSATQFYVATKRMNKETEELCLYLEKFRDAPTLEENELASADFLVVYHKGRFWRAKKGPNTPLELHAMQYGCRTTSVCLVDRGEVVTVPINKCYKVSKADNLRRTDPLCIRAHLADIIPSANDGTWSGKAITCFKKNTLRDDLKLLPRTLSLWSMELLFQGLL